jgi:hypothetical protein
MGGLEKKAKRAVKQAKETSSKSAGERKHLAARRRARASEPARPRG